MTDVHLCSVNVSDNIVSIYERDSVSYSEPDIVTITLFDSESNIAIPQNWNSNKLILNSLHRDNTVCNEIEVFCRYLSSVEKSQMYLMSFSYIEGKQYIVFQNWSFELFYSSCYNVIGSAYFNNKLFIVISDSSFESNQFINLLFEMTDDIIYIKFIHKFIPGIIVLYNDNVTRAECIIDNHRLYIKKLIQDSKIIETD